MICADHWIAERIYAPAHTRGVPGCLLGHGAHGRQPVPGHPDGPGPRADVVPAVPNAVRHQASPLGGHHSPGRLSRRIASSKHNSNGRSPFHAGFEAIQHRREIGLYA